MKHILYPFLAAIVLPLSLVFGQSNLKQAPSAMPELTPMSAYDSLMLSQIPELKLPVETTRRMLPYAVDNSGKPWFRPLIAQVGLECGQASSIGVAFTYEMNYARNLPGNVPENQYATHFAYNFINGGVDKGVSFFETFEILRQAGTPSVADYGGMSAGGPSRWMTGYDLYYNAMHNRISGVSKIKVNTAEGIQTLKNWIYDHANGSSAGGLGNFYAEFTHPPLMFPEGTPEAGKHVIVAWGNSANHAMTIVGYNDSIRWDYNGDGRYTNNVDINLDGVVDVRDWEIGGFKMANTYGSISGWGDQGFSYMMYKSVADQFQQGGIWNNTVVIMDVRDNHEPQLTARLNLTYGCRELLRVMAGVSTNPQATEPDFILHYPIFDFQGGCNPMQGGSGVQTIEFGLDLNLLLQYVTPGQEARFFIMVQENDPFGSQDGTLESCSLVDYTNGGITIGSQINELPLVNNGITMVPINASLNFDPVNITTDQIPPVQLYSNYSTQLEADGGTPPYRWSIKDNYTRSDSTATMPEITQVKLQLSSNSSGQAMVELPFDFPFYGQSFNQVYATSDGYLMLENSLLPWPYYIQGRTYFIQTPMIAPVMSNPLVVGSGEGVWYEAAQDYVTFRWKLSVSGSSGTTFNATARLFNDGRIELNYGECILPGFVERYAGISAGDGENYTLLTYAPDFIPDTNQLVRFTPATNYTCFTLSKDGVLSGTTSQLIDQAPITVCATDKNNLKTTKTFSIVTEGLLMDFDVISGNDSIAGYGESGSVTLHITNLNSFSIGNTTFNLSSFDPYFNLVVHQCQLTGLQSGESIALPDAFLFTVSEQIPDSHVASFLLNAVSAQGTWSRILNITGHRPVCEVAGITVADGNNGILEPGEMALLVINMQNTGGTPLPNAMASISTWDPYLNIVSASASKDTLYAGDTWSATFVVSLSAATPLDYMALINLAINGDHQFAFLQTLPLYTGLIVETFETGDFASFAWQTGGDAPWYTEQGSAKEGAWCARSGALTDNQSSILSLTWDVAYNDSISFWFKVSSEANYDYLHFSTRDGEQGKWAGTWDWTKAKFQAPAGENTFAWKYIKDYSVSNGEDCARVDYILLPVFAVPTSNASPETFTGRLNVYPNPAGESFTITCSVAAPSPLRVMVVDMQGSVVYTYDSEQAVPSAEYRFVPQLSLSQAGVYSIVMITNEGIQVKKLVKTLN